MSNPLKDKSKNPLKLAYENFWVPFLGRILMSLASWIEGEEPKDGEKQTFNLRDQ